MNNPEKLRPALMTIDGGSVQVLDLTEKEGILAVPTDRGYRHIGEVFQEAVVVDGMSVKRWFARTMVDSTLGPFSSRPPAVDALMKWNHLRQAIVEETTVPLF